MDIVAAAVVGVVVGVVGSDLMRGSIYNSSVEWSGGFVLFQVRRFQVVASV